MVSDEIHDIDREKMESFVRVLGTVIEEEPDGDHVQGLFNDYGTIMKLYGQIVWPDGTPDSEDVEVALRIAEKHAGESLQKTFSVHVTVRGSLPEPEDESSLLRM